MAENDTADLGSSEEPAVDDLYRYTDDEGRKNVTARGSRAHLEHLEKLKLAALVEGAEAEAAELATSGEKPVATADADRSVDGPLDPPAPAAVQAKRTPAKSAAKDESKP
ncbi:hypothetical protein JWS13_39150 [Rhodococcus pseudokoreensis]|uniref:Lsr2 protein n=1 Tax=Rhodococcus pseudokoreensis TaxID=2811421 RepID=A0A974ZXP1_9NOCA|nr:hypothetical protein [Rhodococcus pseudokoreensis]QSE94195.1 hypothetical protein JWS13_39150 [Rhodococcus pseudokoreensis]